MSQPQRPSTVNEIVAVVAAAIGAAIPIAAAAVTFTIGSVDANDSTLVTLTILSSFLAFTAYLTVRITGLARTKPPK